MTEPPNLRFADGERDCGSCRAFKPEAQVCAMFDDHPVAPDLVCDSWVAKDSGQVSADGPDS